MKTINIKNIVLLSSAVLLVGTSCKKGCTDPNALNYDDSAKKMDNSCEYEEESEESDINLKFYHELDGQSFAFNQNFTDDFGNMCTFTRAEMYISNPVYWDDQGGEIASPAEYILISPDETTYPLGTLPQDTHVHTMDLTIGVDSVANAGDPAGYSADHALAYQTPSMHWNWNSGYIFMAIEGHVDTSGNGLYEAGEDFIMHVGMNSMRREVVGLMAHFNTVEGQTHNIELDINWAELVAGINLKTDNSSHTMDNMSLAAAVANNAPNAITIHP
ncbi:MbnP family protein [Parvicella tangerina]|uniref:Copper-binding protein MbnP-like domain-containing protein n=1 Tax=Parvicella tangerina TaxID=2829795 RepID=A0A916JKQ6_9FLAO|nr:MbnP family protein [Parvicella tangerina]CAG5078752.1 hypothetical protein CRYO30217_00757 [Parvicella tangerina]